MYQEEHALDRDIIGACGLTVSRTCAAYVGSGALDLSVLKHGLPLSSLRHEVMVVAHDRVHGDAVWTTGLAHPAGVAAVKLAAALLFYIAIK